MAPISYLYSYYLSFSILFDITLDIFSLELVALTRVSEPRVIVALESWRNNSDKQ